MNAANDQTSPLDEKTPSQEISFKAEIRQLLNILVHSLYTEREIFLRELISNASDALNQIHFELLTNHEALDAEAELCIRISANPDEKTLVIEDSGVGMTRDELVENLGTIAHSGAKAFMQALEDAPGADQKPQAISDIIGQFGVGFYSVFMVAESVKVTSRSFRSGEKAFCWSASGDDTYTITPAEKAERGTRIEIHLKEDAGEFAQENRLRSIVRKHSDYVSFPIYWADGTEKINSGTAIWMQSPSEVEEERYNDYYKQFTYDLEDPLMHMHLVTDAPVQMHAILYVPARSEAQRGWLRREEGLRLYARRVLIEDHTKELLPPALRFVSGVVDSEDLPLNVARESIQSNVWTARLKKILTGRLISALKELSAKDKEKYEKFWSEFGKYIKEGISTSLEQSEKDSFLSLLRVRTSKFPSAWSSLNEYVGRMKTDQKAIYYVLGTNEQSVAQSPHLDYFAKKGYEVIYLTEAIDSFLVLGWNTFEGFPVHNVATAPIEEEGKEGEEKPADDEKVDAGEFAPVVARFKAFLGDKVSDVRVTDRLTGSMARLVDPEGGMGAELERVYRMIGEDHETKPKILELNPTHPVLVRLAELPEGNDLADVIMDVTYQNSLLIEGIHPNPAAIIPLTQKLMEAAVQGK